MRIALAFLMFALAADCGRAPPPQIDRIEIRQSGEAATGIVLDRRGGGRFELRAADSRTRRGAFSFTPGQFEGLRARLEPLRAQAQPWTDENIIRSIDAACPRGTPYVTDAGGMLVHWQGPATNEYYDIQFGCDPPRNAARNRELRDIIASFPVPH